MLVAVHEFVLGLYLPPVFEGPFGLGHPRRSFVFQSKQRCEHFVEQAHWRCL